jgi:hypothetical protein
MIRFVGLEVDEAQFIATSHVHSRFGLVMILLGIVLALLGLV